MDICDRDLDGIIKYAKTQCEDKCPADRDPETCLALIYLCECLKADKPSCYEETEGFSKKFFSGKVKEIEKKRGKKIQEVLAEISKKGVRALEDDLDRMEGEFALKAMKAIDEREKMRVRSP
jgi:hypothetical protein